MSYPSWPATLTRFERSGWQTQMQDGRQPRQSDAGPPGYRRRFSGVATFVALSLVVNRAGKSVFDQFYRDTCAGGTGLFWMPDPSTDRWSLLSSTGAPLLSGDVPLGIAKLWLCRFADQVPTETIVGDVEFRKSFNIAVMP